MNMQFDITGSRMILLLSISVSLGLFSCQKESVLPDQLAVKEGAFTQSLYIPPYQSASDSEVSIQTIKQGLLQFAENSIAYHNAPMGPVFESHEGQTAQILLNNQGNEASNIHWHGLLVPADMDGHPDNEIKPGQSKQYTFQVQQRASAAWYHPHLHGTTGSQLTRGLAGLWIHRDAEEAELNLPSGEYEIPMLIQDKRKDQQGLIAYNPTPEEIATGFFGDHVTVNGIHAPYHMVKKGWYRLRVVNASTARIYNLSLNNGKPLYIIGNDGGLLSQPVTVQEALISPGERLDILVDFTTMEAGKNVYLVSNQFQAGVQGKQYFRIMRFEVISEAAPTFKIPAQLSSWVPASSSLASTTRKFDIGVTHDGEHGVSHGQHGGGAEGDYAGHTINGKAFDPIRIDEISKAGTFEIWEFDNLNGDEAHPMHIHGAMFQILDRQGNRSSVLRYERGWKDTVLCLPGEKIRILVAFGPHHGKFVFHCHNVEHGDDGMMLNLQLQ